MVSETYKPSQHGGTKKDGTEDKRFAHPSTLIHHFQPTLSNWRIGWEPDSSHTEKLTLIKPASPAATRLVLEAASPPELRATLISLPSTGVLRRMASRMVV